MERGCGLSRGVALLLGALLAGCAGGDSASREELAALAPAELTLRDLAAMRLPALPDTTDKKSRVRAMYHWVVALHDVQDGEWQEALAQLGVARSLYADVTQQEKDWHARFRNLEAACRYMLDPPGNVQEKCGALVAPRPDSVLDVHYAWLLGLDALRAGDREVAVRHLEITAGSEFPIAAQAQVLLGRLEWPREPEASEAAH